jgi:drug/metabolite transporter (DMT)-like permease
MMIYVLLAFLSACLFGAAAPLGKALLPAFSPFQLAGMLYLGAALGVSPFAFRGKRQPFSWHSDRKNIRRLSLAILCGGIIAPLFLLQGLVAASAASVSLWLPLELVATAILGVLFFRDHLGKNGWLGMIGIVVASILLSLNESISGPKSGLLILTACVCWGIDNNLTALIDNISPAQSTFWKGLVAGIVNLSIGLLIQPFRGTEFLIGAALGVGALSYGASIVLYITAAQNVGASRAQMFFATSPFFGVAFSTLLLGESISVVQWIAASVILGSLVLVYYDKHAHQHTHDTIEHKHGHRHDDDHHNHKHPEKNEIAAHFHHHWHDPLAHSHPHWPDLHHRHDH